MQTFVLAEQTNGYFVLNDIFRYLAEEPEEEEEQVQPDPAAPSTGVQEAPPTAAVPEVEHVEQPAEIAAKEEDLAKVDDKLETAAEAEGETVREPSPPPAAVNGTPVTETAQVEEAEEAPAAAVSSAPETGAKPSDEPAVEETAEPEKPKEVAATSAAAPPKAATVPTPAAPKPSVPRTWASLAASANKVATPNVPVAVTSQAPSQAKATAPASGQLQPSATPAAQAATPAREPSPSNSQGEAAGWQTAGAGHKKEQSRTQNQPATDDQENKRAYIKNVYSQVEEQSLRNVLSKFGEIVYLDIARQKVRTQCITSR